ncbi:hypothetical protein E4U21_000433, partial [Claviceps maximensis]
YLVRLTDMTLPELPNDDQATQTKDQERALVKRTDAPSLSMAAGAKAVFVWRIA